MLPFDNHHLPCGKTALDYNTVVDLGADFEWKISGRVAVFVEGRNLLDRKLYEYPWYPEYRVNFTAGAKVVF